MTEFWQWARRRAGSLAMGVVGVLMVAAAIWLVEDRSTLAGTLVVMGSILLVVAVLNNRFAGRFRLGPLETKIESVDRRVEELKAGVQELQHTTEALIVKINPAVEHDQALPITPSKSRRIGMAEEHDQALPVTPRKSPPERPGDEPPAG